MKRHLKEKLVYLVLLVVLFIPGIVGCAKPPPHKQTALRDEMRLLWGDHVVWTRGFIVSSTSNLPDKNVVTQRLMENQVEIGDSIKPFYGDQAGDRLTSLLRDHINYMAELIEILKVKDTNRIEDAKRRLFINADEIAEFLHQANPDGWPLQETKEMMYAHLNLTINETIARLDKDWNKDIDAYDKVYNQILHMADTISDGIIKQFPDKFK
jgi:hypothetical protein